MGAGRAGAKNWKKGRTGSMERGIELGGGGRKYPEKTPRLLLKDRARRERLSIPWGRGRKGSRLGNLGRVRIKNMGEEI